MDYINNYSGGGPSGREKEIVNILKEKYDELEENELITV